MNCTCSVSGVVPPGDVFIAALIVSALQAAPAPATPDVPSSASAKYCPIGEGLRRWKCVAAPSAEATSAISQITSPSSAHRVDAMLFKAPRWSRTSRDPSIDCILPELSTTTKRTGNPSMDVERTLVRPSGQPISLSVFILVIRRWRLGRAGCPGAMGTATLSGMVG